MYKPFAESSEQNKEAILKVLGRLFARTVRVLEIGSGTGQHAVHFARHLPHLLWQTSELTANHTGIQRWLEEADLPNVVAPLALDVTADAWPQTLFDAVFSANTVHIMSWPAVQAMIAGVGEVLAGEGLFVLYGPFHFGGRPSAPSNAQFDRWLRERDPASGVRNFEDLNALAATAGMAFAEDIEMPVNNRILVWRKPLD